MIFFLNCLNMKKLFITLFACLLAMQLSAQTKKRKTSNNNSLPPALSAIKEADIKHDIFELAGDAFRGRRAGTNDEMRAAAWVAQKAQEAGLKPAGEDGTYFQFYNLRRTRIGANGTFTINGQKLVLWEQVWPVKTTDVHLNASVVWLNPGDTTNDIRGKTVAMKIIAPKPLPVSGMSLWGYRYTAAAIRQQGQMLRRKGAAAIILVADDIVEGSLAFTGHNYEEGQYQLADVAVNNRVIVSPATAPLFLVRSAIGQLLHQSNVAVKADCQTESFLYPSVNVVAKAIGTDPKLRHEYVLFSGHHDHDGVGTPVDRDSIWNGADDNASVTVGMLAIGRSWSAKPGKRSALFVWHGAEERGLLGSRWFVAHPTANKQSIVAVLNADMIGRNAPDSAALLGTTSHKNSTQLVTMSMKANDNLTHFKLDFSWDDAQHPENWYFRSDHLPYAQAGIPAIFFTTLLHPEYHTPKDEPQLIDIAKLTKMAKWMYATGWLVSETTTRPALDTK
jgi:hypothetical protein